MKSSSRIILNTIVQYVRAIVTIFVTLYTSRVILENLGVNDFGIYALIGGVVVMFAFIQNSLSRTAQRFLNYYHGRNDIQTVVKVFNNSVICQFVISIVLCISLISVIQPVVNQMLNIDSNKIFEAKIIYILMVISLFFNLQSAPYLAALIARENMTYSSIVQILDAIIKIPIAVSLFYISEGKLILYASMMMSLTIFNFVMYYVYSTRKYIECSHFTVKSLDWNLIKEMFGFTVWSTYGTMAVVGRTQGIAILLNRFYNTAINTAYGIGTQVVGQLNFLSSAIANAINPQMVKAEGSGDRHRAIRLAEISAKYSCLLVSALLIPTYLYIDFLLSEWLKNVPEYTSMFCRYSIIITIIELSTQSLNYLNGAIGNVRLYSNIIYSIILLTLPFAYLGLSLGYGAGAVMVAYAVIAFLCGIARIIFLKYDISLSIKEYCLHVFYPIVVIMTANALVCFWLHCYLHGWYVIITCIVSAMLTFGMMLIVGLQNDERIVLSDVFYKLIKLKCLKSKT